MAGVCKRIGGLWRSLVMYYWPPGSGRRLDRFYGEFVGPDDLCFDIGAHVGNRTMCFLRLGARVVAVEPQPDFGCFLRLLLKWRKRVTLLDCAIGAEEGDLELHLSLATPTVSSGSAEFMRDTGSIASFDIVDWDRVVRVRQTTLDELAERYGMPDFIKLDIEGMELAALQGMCFAPRMISFEFLAGRTDDAMACIDRLEQLADWRYNLSTGESLSMQWPDWRSSAALASWLEEHAGRDFSGDIYARRRAPKPMARAAHPRAGRASGGRSP